MGLIIIMFTVYIIHDLLIFRYTLVRVITFEKLIAYSFQISVISIQIKLMSYVLIPRTSYMLIPLL